VGNEIRSEGEGKSLRRVREEKRMENQIGKERVRKLDEIERERLGREKSEERVRRAR
jgi:hypothetical protein